MQLAKIQRVPTRPFAAPLPRSPRLGYGTGMPLPIREKSVYRASQAAPLTLFLRLPMATRKTERPLLALTGVLIRMLQPKRRRLPPLTFPTKHITLPLT